MTDAARSGVGAILRITSTSPWTVVGEVVNIAGPQESVDQTEATTLDSTGGFKEYIPALKDGGSITIPILWTNTAAQRSFRNLFGNVTPTSFSITLPTSPQTLVEFDGFIQSRNWTINPTDPMQAEVQIKISGQVTYTP